MSEEQLKELQEYNLEYLEAQSSEEIFGGDYTSAVELKYAKKEIERLNTIINELEKYLIAEIEDYDKSINSKFITDISKEQYEGEKVCFEDMLGRLQELKGSDKE